MKQLPPSKPMRFALPNGRIVLVGRNNLQNDKLTFTAQPDEIWLQRQGHARPARDYRGRESG